MKGLLSSVVPLDCGCVDAGPAAGVSGEAGGVRMSSVGFEQAAVTAVPF